MTTFHLNPILDAKQDLAYINWLAGCPPRSGLTVLFPGRAIQAPYQPFTPAWSEEDIKADCLAMDADALIEEVRNQLATANFYPFFERFPHEPPNGIIDVRLTRYGPGGSYHPNPRRWAITCNLFHLFSSISNIEDKSKLNALPTSTFEFLDAGVVLHELTHLFVAPIFMKAWGDEWNDLSNGNHYRVEQTVDLLLNSGELATFFPPKHSYYRAPFFRAGHAPTWRDS